jgi:oxalate decarboxylase/phosphoglucose isomerase-like protein (cupin superfamily)
VQIYGDFSFLQNLEAMIIKFDESNHTILPNFKGGDKEFSAHMFYDGTNRILKGILVPGASIGVHKHEGNCEVIFILSGKGAILEQAPGQEQTLTEVSAGDCLYCPEGHTHSLMNTSEEGDLVFYAVVAAQ